MPTGFEHETADSQMSEAGPQIRINYYHRIITYLMYDTCILRISVSTADLLTVLSGPVMIISGHLVHVGQVLSYDTVRYFISLN